MLKIEGMCPHADNLLIKNCHFYHHESSNSSNFLPRCSVIYSPFIEIECFFFPNSKKIIWVHQEAKSLQRINFQSGRNIFCSYLLLLISSWLRIHRFVWTLNSYKFIKKVFSWLPIIFLKKSRCVYSFLVVGNSLQCSCLENPRDGGAWWAAIYGVAQSRTRLKWLSSSLYYQGFRAIGTHQPIHSGHRNMDTWPLSEQPYLGGRRDSKRVSQVTQVVKNPPDNAVRRKRCRFDPWLWKISWRRARQHILVFCLENPLDRGSGRLQSIGLHRVWHIWSNLEHTHTHTHTHTWAQRTKKGHEALWLLNHRGHGPKLS